MRSRDLVDATDLDQFANRRESQALLPELVRRLILASVPRVLRIGFRAGEGVQLPGWDGTLTVEGGTAFVPDGASVWELTTDSGSASKASEDYKKRVKDPAGVLPSETVFAFATLRRWAGKETWATERRQEGIWRDVRAYDADDLVTWLEQPQAVHVWISGKLAKRVAGVLDLETYWNDWRDVTRPPMPAGVVLAGRGETVKRVNDWLSRTPSEALTIRADSRAEAIAVFAAAIQELTPAPRDSALSRSLVVRDPEAWEHFAAASKGLILVANCEIEPEALTRALRGQHAIFVPRRADGDPDAPDVVNRLSREEAAKALTAAGVPANRAEDLAALARRSLTSFRRKLAVSPTVQQPAWARPEAGRTLLPAFLAGAWNDGAAGDREVLAELAQKPYEAYRNELVRWANEDDPPLRRNSGNWFLSSAEDAWILLARYVVPEDFDRLGKAVLDVLGVADPQFELAAERRWLAAVSGDVPRHSGALRKGFAETLAVLGARELTLPTGQTSAGMAARIVGQLLDRAISSWRIWASLTHELRLLAEAAPETFLAALEKALTGERPQLPRLFAEEGEPLFGSAPHTALLWALETLAWSQEHLGRAALVLATLARLDPGGHVANRPKNSLREIFSLWKPQTSATVEQRLRVLDAIRERESAVAWNLLLGLLPRNHDVVTETPQPRWRDWVGEPKGVSGREFALAVAEVTTRLLIDVGNSGERWAALLEAADTMPKEQYERVLKELEALDPASLSRQGRAMVCNVLRDTVAHHRSFPDAHWAMPKEDVERLASFGARFEAASPLDRSLWLFTSHPDLPTGRHTDWREQQKAVEEARIEALREILKEGGGLPVLIELARRVEQPGEVGFALGKSNIPADDDKLLSEHLANPEKPNAQFARGFAVARLRTRGRDWAETRLSGIAQAWPAEQKAEFLYCLDADPAAWKLVEATDPETQRLYWRKLLPYGIAETADVVYASRKLLEHGRPFTALDMLAMRVAGEKGSQIPPALLADALEAVLRAEDESDAPMNSFSHHLMTVIEVLERSDLDRQRVAALEWGLLPLFRRDGRAPTVLLGELNSDPKFFVDILSLVYRAKDEPVRELPPEERVRADYSRDLLECWRSRSRAGPGVSPSGQVDPQALKDWVRRARTAAMNAQRQSVADVTIGQVLAGVPAGDDGAWPHPAVRDLIEEFISDDFEQGLDMGVVNRRGVVTKAANEGGAQEHLLAARYSEFAAKTQDHWPRTTALLRGIAAHYRAQGGFEDRSTDLRQDLY